MQEISYTCLSDAKRHSKGFFIIYNMNLNNSNSDNLMLMLSRRQLWWLPPPYCDIDLKNTSKLFQIYFQNYIKNISKTTSKYLPWQLPPPILWENIVNMIWFFIISAIITSLIWWLPPSPTLWANRGYLVTRASYLLPLRGVLLQKYEEVNKKRPFY